MTAPSPDDVRRALAGLDDRKRKIVAGLFALLIENPTRARDREWVCEELARVTTLAGGFEADSPDAGVAAVEGFLREHSEALLGATFLLFQRVGLDLAPRAAAGFSFEEALRAGLAYLPAE